MANSRKRVTASDRDDQALRDQEVLRANKELAAYFRGMRTEREARAALKIIKAFIRHRERMSPSERRPLPRTSAAHPQKAVKKVVRRRRTRKTEAHLSNVPQPVNEDVAL